MGADVVLNGTTAAVTRVSSRQEAAHVAATRRRATRATASLARDAEDLVLLLDMLGLDAAEGKTSGA